MDERRYVSMSFAPVSSLLRVSVVGGVLGGDAASGAGQGEKISVSGDNGSGYDRHAA